MIAEQTPEEVIERQKAAVYRLAYSRLQNREDAEDVLQEVFLRYIRSAPDFGALERALAELKPEAREIVHLYYYEGYRTAEIASVVGIGEGSVRSSLARSRRRIKKILEKEGVKIEV